MESLSLSVSSYPGRQLETIDESPRRSSLDLITISSLLSPSIPKIRSQTSSISSVSLDGHRLARFSSLSSSYAQFLKQRDCEKVKKIVSEKRKRRTA